MSTQAPAVSVDGLTKIFHARPAVEEISFAVEENQFVTLVGPSGCGKSTTLRLIAGLLRPTAGKVESFGREVTGPLSGAAMVFQSPVLLPWRNTVANILFTAEMRGLEGAPYRTRALELVALAGLEGFERALPHELSGGMQQRVAICRALLLDPPVLLMDEPFGALDVMTRERMGFELQRIWSAKKNTVLFVTHSITEAVLLSDVVIIVSARPGRTKAIVPIDLPRPRAVDTLSSPRFLELAARIRDGLEGGRVE
jgi:NitT/TauT family transport system ATP-binding protein